MLGGIIMKKNIVMFILLILAGCNNIVAMKRKAFDSNNQALRYHALGLVKLYKDGGWSCLRCNKSNRYKGYKKINNHMAVFHGIKLVETTYGLKIACIKRARKRKRNYCGLDNNDLEPKTKKRKQDSNQGNQGIQLVPVTPAPVASVLPKPRPKKLVQNIQTTQNMEQVEFLSVREPSQKPMLKDFSKLKNVTNREILEKNNASSKRSRRCKYVSMGHMKFFGRTGFKCCYCDKKFREGPNSRSNMRCHLDGYRRPGRINKISHNVDVDKHISKQDFTKLKGVTNKEILKKYAADPINLSMLPLRPPSKYVKSGHMKFVGKYGYQCCYCDKEFLDTKSIRCHLSGYRGPRRKRSRNSHNVDVDKHISKQDFTKLQGVTNKEVLRKYNINQTLQNSLRGRQSKYVYKGHMKLIDKYRYQCCYCYEIFPNAKKLGLHLDGYRGSTKKRSRDSHNVDVDKHISKQDFSSLQNVTNKETLKKYGNLD